MTSNDDAQTSTIDMNLYSRQIGAFGVETMGKLVKMNVLIVGMKGVGVETAKNLILAGPASVTLVDNEPVALLDLGTNFYLSESSVGKPRAQECARQLSELNSYVDVNVHSGDVNEAFIDKFQVVVFTTGSRDALLRLNQHCHDNDIVFIYCCAHGVTGSIFSDFGSEFSVLDADGEPPIHNVIMNVEVKDGKGIIYTEHRHRLQTGDTVSIDEVTGDADFVAQLNGKEFEIEVIKLNHFSIGPLKAGAYETGGVSIQLKKPKQMEFRSLGESIANPVAPNEWSLLVSDFGKFGRAEQLHFALLALWEFEKRNGALPRLHSEEDAEQCVAIAKEILVSHLAQPEDAAVLKVEEIDTMVVRQRALYARVELMGFTAYFGGVVAQEVVKYTGKFTPIHQWVHLDAFELVGEKVLPDTQPAGSRYDNQIAVFGAAYQQKLASATYFVVGAGALGCEYLKSCALMGIGCGPKGKIYVTDMDTIEVSNLNRQFLFRPDNVGQAKSTCAAAAAKTMNPDLNIQSFLIRVGPDTEDSFDDAFWDGLDGVVNALDNVTARKYVDSKCVLHAKPLLESGTLGTKANSQVVLPFESQSYGETEDPEEDAIPMCTLRNFPHLIEHCIEWARAEFSGLFSDGPQEANSFLKGHQKYFDQLSKEGNVVVQLEKIRTVRDWLSRRNAPNMDECVREAFKLWHMFFRDRILDLTRAFPVDARVTKDGVEKGLFWSGSKRFPTAENFDANNECHLDFVLNTANIFAFNFGIPSEPSREASPRSCRDWPSRNTFRAAKRSKTSRRTKRTTTRRRRMRWTNLKTPTPMPSNWRTSRLVCSRSTAPTWRRSTWPTSRRTTTPTSTSISSPRVRTCAR
eukprot:1088245_1